MLGHKDSDKIEDRGVQTIARERLADRAYEMLLANQRILSTSIITASDYEKDKKEELSLGLRKIDQNINFLVTLKNNFDYTQLSVAYEGAFYAKLSETLSQLAKRDTEDAAMFIQIFYDARYHDAAAYFALLAFSAWLTTVDGFYGAGFLASGRPRLVAFTNLVKFLVFIALVMPFSQMWGVIGAIFALVVADAARAGVNLFLGAQLGFSRLRTDLTYLGVFLLGLGSLTLLSGLVGERFSLSSFMHVIIDAGMLLLTISVLSLVFLLARRRGSRSLN